jgi:dipeptidyl aminopeptidase/acylaminoacyl peptidase
LYRQGRDDAEPEVVLDPPDGACSFHGWSPEGTKVTYQYRHRDFLFGGDPFHNLHMLDVATGETTQITDERDSYDVFSSWSPSGKWVAIEGAYVEPKRRKAVFLYEVESGELTEVPRQRCILQRYSWSLDSQYLLVRINGDGWRRLEIIRVEDMETVWSHESPKIRGGAFAPDGDHFICEMEDELLWYEFPSGELLQKLSLDGIGMVEGFAPGSQISFGLEGDVFFLTKESKIYRWEVGGDCSLVVDVEPPAALPEFTQEEYAVTSRDGSSIPVQRYVPTNPKRVAVMYVDPYEKPSPRRMMVPMLLEHGFEVVFPAHRGSPASAEEPQGNGEGDVGRGEVWELIATAQDWKRRAGGDRPLVIFASSRGGLFSLLALAQEPDPWDGAVMMAPLSSIDVMNRLSPQAWLDDPAERDGASAELSPVEQAHKIQTPIRIFHGGRDQMSNVEHIREIQGRIEAAGGECALTIYENDIHLLGGHRDEIIAETLKFLQRFE